MKHKSGIYFPSRQRSGRHPSTKWPKWPPSVNEVAAIRRRGGRQRSNPCNCQQKWITRVRILVTVSNLGQRCPYSLRLVANHRQRCPYSLRLVINHQRRCPYSLRLVANHQLSCPYSLRLVANHQWSCPGPEWERDLAAQGGAYTERPVWMAPSHKGQGFF